MNWIQGLRCSQARSGCERCVASFLCDVIATTPAGPPRPSLVCGDAAQCTTLQLSHRRDWRRPSRAQRLCRRCSVRRGSPQFIGGGVARRHSGATARAQSARRVLAAEKQQHYLAAFKQPRARATCRLAARQDGARRPEACACTGAGGRPRPGWRRWVSRTQVQGGAARRPARRRAARATAACAARLRLAWAAAFVLATGGACAEKGRCLRVLRAGRASLGTRRPLCAQQACAAEAARVIIRAAPAPAPLGPRGAGAGGGYGCAYRRAGAGGLGGWGGVQGSGFARAGGFIQGSAHAGPRRGRMPGRPPASDRGARRRRGRRVRGAREGAPRREGGRVLVAVQSGVGPRSARLGLGGVGGVFWPGPWRRGVRAAKQQKSFRRLRARERRGCTAAAARASSTRLIDTGGVSRSVSGAGRQLKRAGALLQPRPPARPRPTQTGPRALLRPSRAGAPAGQARRRALEGPAKQLNQGGGATAAAPRNKQHDGSGTKGRRRL